MAFVTQEEYDTARAELAALNSRIAGGERQVVVGDESVLYNTTDSLITARNDLVARLSEMVVAGNPAVRPRPRQRLLMFGGRGYW